ncbi:MAG: hypothetical protein ABIN83_06170 [Sphingomicrobium sp.]
MNPLEFVIAIVAITTIGGILRARAGGHTGRRFGRGRDRMMGIADLESDGDSYAVRDTAENVRLREEVKMLKERVQTLERITVDKENSLSREIDSLRDR